MIEHADHWKEHIDKVFLLKHFSSCSILSEAVRINYYMCIEMLCIQYTIYHQIIMKLGISGVGGEFTTENSCSHEGRSGWLF